MKSAVPVVVMALVAVLVGALSLVRLTQVNQDLNDIKRHHLAATEQIAVLQNGIGTEFRSLFLLTGVGNDPALK